MKKNKVVGNILIFLPFLFLQMMGYYGSYLETNSWEITFNKEFSSLPYAIGSHIFIIIGIIVVIVINKKQSK